VDGEVSYWEEGRPRRPERETKGSSDADECTFKPQIRPLPEYYGSQKHLDSVPFEQRVKQWNQHREALLIRQREKGESKEVDECTFKPAINPKSKKTAERNRTDSSLPVSDRLYRHARSMSATRERAKATLGFETKEEEEIRMQCTFRPKINPSRDATPVRSRYMNHTMASKSASGAAPGASTSRASGMEECTFTPRTNAVPRVMESAHAYLQKDVVDRLSQPRAATISKTLTRSSSFSEHREGGDDDRFFDGKDPSRSVLDMSTYLAVMDERKRGNTSSFNPDSPQRSQSNPRGGRGGDASSVGSAAVSKERLDEMFSEFLARQKAAEKAKERKLEEVAKVMYSEVRSPELCPNSLKLVKDTQSTNFLQRVAKDSLKKEHKSHQKKAVLALDTECSFQPKINKRSKELKGRSVVDMSRGDMLRKENAQRLMRLKAEQAQLDGLTFQPEINPASREIEGRLRLASEGDTYLQRVQLDMKLFSDRQRKAAQEAEMQEFAECTFHPEVHDAPAYVKHIARVMAMTKAVKPKTDEKTKPDWK